MKAGHGKVVRVHYRLTGDDGTLLDSSDGQEPLTYLHGYDGLLPGLERGLEGLEPGQHARVDLEVADAYGPHDPEAVIHATRDQFPDGLVLTPGLEVSARSDEGTMTFRVVEVSDSGAVLDGNHPLAGQNLHFDVDVLEVREATPEEIAHGHVHGVHEHEHEHEH
jgi:FKBP-type peptidyl-prolyl cis-trans isomerase SlyD